MKTKYVFPPLQVERKVCARVSHPNFRSVVVVLSAFLLVVMGSLVSPQAASAGSGSIPEFSVDNNLNVHIRVSCPGSVGFTWQVAVDNWGNVFYEEGSAGKDFHMDGGRISNGHHNALARVRCNGEPTDWSGATSSTVGFDWYGGNPTPVPPPPGYEVSISLAVDHMTVPPNGQIRITAQASCSNTTVRAIRIKANSGVFYELGSLTVTTTWSSGNPGTYVITAEAACNGDDQWKTSPGASVTVTVQQGAQPGPGGSGTGTAGNQVNPAPSNPQPQSGSGASIPQARQAGNSGGFDLITVAYAWGYGNVHNDNGRWDGWIMDGGGKPAKRLTMGDFSVICQQVYGNGYSATRIGNGAGDIKCVQGGSNPPQQNPVVQPNTNACPSTPTRLRAGDIAVVSDLDSYPLKVWDQPGNPDAPTIFTVPIREQLTIVENPFCRVGRVWVKIGYQGKLGFAVEVTIKNMYNLIPNGQSFPDKKSPQLNGFSCPGKLAIRLGLSARAQVTRGDPLALRPNAESGDIITKYPQGTQFTVIGGPFCGVYNVWWRVRMDDGNTGWFPEGRSDVGYWVEPVQEQAPVQRAEATPPPIGPVSVKEETINCYELGYDDSLHLVNQAYAAGPSCTTYVAGTSQGRKLSTCWQQQGLSPWPAAYLWDDRARSTAQACDLIVNPSQPGRKPDLSQIQTGNIAVWEPGCAGADSSNGHVAIVTSKDIGIGKIIADEAHWSDPRNVHYVDNACTSFIRVGEAGVSQTTDKQVQQQLKDGIAPTKQLYPSLPDGYALAMPTQVHICGPICSDGEWIEFLLPKGHYDLGNVDLHFYFMNSGAVLSWMNSVKKCTSQPNPTYDCIKVGVDDRLLRLLVSSGLVKLADVQDPTNWYLTFKRV